MTEKKVLTPEGRQTFAEIIEEELIYVDKTQYLANMLNGGNKTWFLARPSGFGKSLTVSTLESIFSGNKNLFKGLYIEKKLDERRFTPRPVIHLDMSKLSIGHGVKKFEQSLRKITLNVAKEHEITLSPDYTSNLLFAALLESCFEKYKVKVAVLIDEYDTPVTALMDKPDEADIVHDILREYYRQLKASDKNISFVFITGISEFVPRGLNIAFNNATDISSFKKFGAITGFTYEEIVHNFSEQIKETANKLDNTPEKLLEEMKNYYDGFCFDDTTLVYNPHSILHLFKVKKFNNF